MTDSMSQGAKIRFSATEAVTDTDHLDDITLVRLMDGRADELTTHAARVHVDACPGCAERLRRVVAASVPAVDVAAQAAARTDALTLPDVARDAALHAGALLRASEIPDPAPGQLWRLQWDDAAVLGVLTRSDDYAAEVVPVTFETWLAGPFTLVIDDGSPLGTPVAAWCDLAVWVSTFTLERCLAVLNPEVLESILSVQAASDRGTFADNATVGTLDVGILDERRQYREALTAQYALFATAEQVSEPLADVVPLPTRLNRAHIGAAELSKLTGLSLSRAEGVVAGVRRLNLPAAQQVAARIGATVDELLAGTPAPPRPLLLALSSPSRWSRVRHRAQRAGVRESTIVRALAAEAEPAAAAYGGLRSARDAADWATTEADEVAYWDALLRRNLDADPQ